MKKQNEKIILPFIGILLGGLALLLSWIPLVNNLAFGLALFGIVITTTSFVKNWKRTKNLTWISLALSIIAGGIVLLTQSSFSKTVSHVNSSISSSTTNN